MPTGRSSARWPKKRASNGCVWPSAFVASDRNRSCSNCRPKCAVLPVARTCRWHNAGSSSSKSGTSVWKMPIRRQTTAAWPGPPLRPSCAKCFPMAQTLATVPRSFWRSTVAGPQGRPSLRMRENRADAFTVPTPGRRSCHPVRKTSRIAVEAPHAGFGHCRSGSRAAAPVAGHSAERLVLLMRRAAERVIAASCDIHAEIVETDFEAAYGYLSQRLRKRSLVVLFTDVIDDVSAKSVVRTVRGLGPRHLALCVLFRDEALDAMVEPQIRQQKPAALYQRAAAAEAVLWRDRLVRELEEAGALVLHVSPGKLTPALINRYLRVKAQRLL